MCINCRVNKDINQLNKEQVCESCVAKAKEELTFTNH